MSEDDFRRIESMVMHIHQKVVDAIELYQAGKHSQSCRKFAEVPDDLESAAWIARGVSQRICGEVEAKVQ